MSDDISPADAARHDEIVDKAWSLVEGEVFLDRSGPSRSFFGRVGSQALCSAPGGGVTMVNSLS